MHSICRLEKKAHDTCYFSKRKSCNVRFSCDLQGHFACTFQHSVSARTGLLQRAPGPKSTTIMNGLIPRLVQNMPNTEGTLCIVKQMDRSRVCLFRSSPKIKSKNSKIEQIRQKSSPCTLVLPQRSREVSPQDPLD